jgi:hypothetical protein
MGIIDADVRATAIKRRMVIVLFTLDAHLGEREAATMHPFSRFRCREVDEDWSYEVPPPLPICAKVFKNKDLVLYQNAKYSK